MKIKVKRKKDMPKDTANKHEVQRVKKDTEEIYITVDGEEILVPAKDYEIQD